MAAISNQALQCYNKGCGQQYDPQTNSEDSCVFHPGMPIFHDAYKGWSCCNKKVTDFTEFLNIKGCTKSCHSNIKPPESEKSKPDPLTKDEVITYAPPQKLSIQVQERPSDSEPMVKLPITIADSLKVAIMKLEEMVISQDSSEDNIVKIGMSCSNHGCTAVYENEDSNNSDCVYHPGVPIFHEGMKYWLCCKKKTTDFSNFLKQEGCTTGKHKWSSKKEVNKDQPPCRYDWHQTGSFVIISVYAKCCNPDLTFVEANPVKIHIYIVFDKVHSVFDMDILLKGVIDISKSSVNLMGTKVEIKLKKAEPFSWNKLVYEE